MIVPPFIPQPIEIEKNVGEEPYPVRVAFVRRVAFLGLLTTAIIVGIGWLNLTEIEAFSAAFHAWLSLALLVIVSALRRIVKGRPMEQRVSGAFLPLLLVSLGAFGRHLHDVGWPVWTFALVPAWSCVYILLCRQDLSFIGMFATAWLGSWAIVLASLSIGWIDQPYLGSALVLTSSYALYWVYDLAALLSRRRVREEVGAVVDLYRDLLNFVGYVPRVWLHWKKHPFWAAR